MGMHTANEQIKFLIDFHAIFVCTKEGDFGSPILLEVIDVKCAWNICQGYVK